MDFEDAFSVSRIQLEPRLQEYLNRLTFNREHDITPDIPLEQEFGITSEDMNIIKRHHQGKDTYSKRRTGLKSNYVEMSKDNFFNEDAFKSDPRYKRLQKKMASHKRAQAQIRNLEGISEEYTIFHRSNPYDDPMNPSIAQNRPTKISKPYNRDPDSDSESDSSLSNSNFGSLDTMMDSRDLVLGSKSNQYMYNPNTQQNRKSQSSYNHRPKISYRNTLIPEQPNGGLDHNHSISDIIGSMDEYNRHLEDSYDYIESTVDQDSRTVRPASRSKTNRETYNSYKSIPYGYGGGLADICVEDSLRGGIKDSGRKTTGFWNPFEHQFDFIDSDISDPNHTVEMRPQNTRGANKVMARPNSMSSNSDRRIRQNQDQEYRRSENISPNQRERRSYERGYADPNRSRDDMVRSAYYR